MVLARAERAYGVVPQAGGDLYARIRHLRKRLLEGLELRHFGRVQAGFDFDRARKLTIRIQAQLLPGSAAAGPYGPPVARPEDPLTVDLEAAALCARLVAFQEGYLDRAAPQERVAETLIKLEREVVGRPIHAPLASRRAVVRVGPVLDVQEVLRGRHAASREALIEAILTRLREGLQGTLDSIEREIPCPAGSRQPSRSFAWGEVGRVLAKVYA